MLRDVEIAMGIVRPLVREMVAWIQGRGSRPVALDKLPDVPETLKAEAEARAKARAVLKG
jgi:hypothetical protein